MGGAKEGAAINHILRIMGIGHASTDKVVGEEEKMKKKEPISQDRGMQHIADWSGEPAPGA